ncbi:MAG: cyclic nucleotide-binding domain-containing protein [bacterium]
MTVDLNLQPRQEYEAPYHPGFHNIKSEYFSVIHSGEGDGWDVDRPCMGSILTFQGKIYLIDAGPNIIHSLRGLGINANNVEGIFHTHSHDDHFIGLTVLMRADHRIKYFATKLVRKSVEKKLAALAGIEEGDFERFFIIRDLAFDEWNDIEGLEVKPVLSPHPVETSILFFRAPWEGDYKTYAHLADIAAFDVLEKMITDDSERSGISRELFEEVKKVYLSPANMKKIDIGGGLIHGRAEDFASDTSDRIILSHTSVPLTDKQKETGANADFGAVDVLISSEQDFTKAMAYRNLKAYFPEAPPHELTMLLNCPVTSFNPGSILIRKGEKSQHVYFILAGVLEFIATEHGVHNFMSSGSIIGEISSLMGTECRGTYRAASYVRTLKIPTSLYLKFAERNGFIDTLKKNIDKRRFLQDTWLFGEMISCPVKSGIADAMKPVDYSKGQALPTEGRDTLYLVESGEIEIFYDRIPIETVGTGGFFGEENVLYESRNLLEAKAAMKSRIYHLPGGMIGDIPIVRWKLVETFERRMKLLGPRFVFA